MRFINNNKFLKLKELLESKKDKLVLDNLDQEKIKNIEFLFKDDNIFFKIEAQTAIGILEFLGIKENEIMDYYFELISPQYLLKEDDIYTTISNKK